MTRCSHSQYFLVCCLFNGPYFLSTSFKKPGIFLKIFTKNGKRCMHLVPSSEPFSNNPSKDFASTSDEYIPRGGQIYRSECQNESQKSCSSLAAHNWAWVLKQPSGRQMKGHPLSYRCNRILLIRQKQITSFKN